MSLAVTLNMIRVPLGDEIHHGFQSVVVALMAGSVLKNFDHILHVGDKAIVFEVDGKFDHKSRERFDLGLDIHLSAQTGNACVIVWF
jgi:hypothetical protein